MNRPRVGGRGQTTTTTTTSTSPSAEVSSSNDQNQFRKLRSSAGKNWLLQSSQWSKSYDSVINYWNTSRSSTSVAGSYGTRSTAAAASESSSSVSTAAGQPADLSPMTRFSGRLSGSTASLAGAQMAAAGGGLNGNGLFSLDYVGD